MIHQSLRRPVVLVRYSCRAQARTFSIPSKDTICSVHRNASVSPPYTSTQSRRVLPAPNRPQNIRASHWTSSGSQSLSPHQHPPGITARVHPRGSGPKDSYKSPRFPPPPPPPPPPRQGRTQLLSAVLLGPIWISLALLSGESLRDTRAEAEQWTDILVDILTPPSRKSNLSYTAAVDNGDDEGYVSEGGDLLDDEDSGQEGGKLRYSGPSPAEQWSAHVDRFFSMGAHHLGTYFRTEHVTDHGPLLVTSEAAKVKYVPLITTKLISVEDDLPPASPDFDGLPAAPSRRTGTITIDNTDGTKKSSNGSGGSGSSSSSSSHALGRFVLAQIAFTDVGLDDNGDGDGDGGSREPSRTGWCASAILDDLEIRLRRLGASRALLVTLDEDSYHTVYWDGRRFVTLNFFEFTPPPRTQ